MKRFEFTLARVHDFRRRQLDLEEAKLQALLAERQGLETETARLQSEASRTRNSLMVTGSVEAQELVAANLYLRRLGIEQTGHAAKVTDWQNRVRKQQEAMVEARRRVRLMEKLEEKQRGAWQSAVDREQEDLASELFLARWKKPGSC